MRILVIEDNTVTREALACQLAARGHVADEAGNAEAAAGKIAVHRYDAFIIDHYLTGVDGLVLLALLRARDATRATPAVLMTAAAGDRVAGELSRQAEALAPAKFLRKPCEVADVVAALESLCERPA